MNHGLIGTWESRAITVVVHAVDTERAMVKIHCEVNGQPTGEPDWIDGEIFLAWKHATGAERKDGAS